MRTSLIYIGLCLALWASGCSEKAEVGTQPTDIVFSAPVLHASKSRAVGEVTVYPRSEKFVIHARLTTGDFVSWEDASAQSFMSDVVVGYASGYNGWASEKDYFWPEIGKVSFVGYSPARLKDNLLDATAQPITYSNSGLMVPNFKVPAKGFHASTPPTQTTPDPHDADTQFDLLYSELEPNRVSTYKGGSQEPNGEYNGVQLKFHHALCSIHFRIVLSPDVKSTIRLVGVNLKEVISVGSFDEQRTNFNPYTAYPEWTYPQNAGDYYRADYEAFTAPVDTQTGTTSGVAIPVGTEPQPIQSLVEGQGSSFILLPQEFTDARPHVALDFLMTAPTGVVLPQHVELPLVDNTPSQKWQVGHRYVYNIHVNTSKIYLNPEVSVWEDTAGGDIFE